MNEHATAWERIPWMVNGTLQGKPLKQLQEHLSGCAECRAEVALQSRMREVIAAQPVVELSPQASLNKLWSRIDTETRFQRTVSQHQPPRHRWWLYALAAQWLLMAGIAWWLVQRSPAEYRTVTSPPAVVQGELKVVFDEQMTLAEADTTIAGAGLVALSGPSPAGVFLLARDAQHRQSDLDAIVTQLRSLPRVRFAERSDVAE